MCRTGKVMLDHRISVGNVMESDDKLDREGDGYH